MPPRQRHPYGRSIRIFLVDGLPQGPRITTNTGWTGSCFDFSRADYGRVRLREELTKSGVYILAGPDDEQGGNDKLYIGEADVVSRRLDDHQAKKEFWTRAYVLTSAAEQLNKAHVRYLESRFIELASRAGLVTLDNGTAPSANSLSDADRADMEYFLDEACVLLPLIGISAFSPIELPIANTQAIKPILPGPRHSVATSAVIDQPDDGTDGPVHYYFNEKNVKAEAVDDAKGFTVLAGSLGRSHAKVMLQGYRDLRLRLLREKVLVPEGDDQLVFSRAYAFRSPSAAASVIIGGSRNGLLVWKDSNHRTLGQRQSDTVS